MAHTYNDSCDICTENGWTTDHTRSANNPPYCSECDGPCKAVRWEGLTDVDKTWASDLGEAKRFMEGASHPTFKMCVEEDFSKCSPPPFDKAGAFTEKFKRNGPLTQEIIDRAIPAEGNGDTFIPRGGKLGKFFDGSIPPGFGTDGSKPIADAMPDTPRQALRQAIVDMISAQLRVIDALDKLDRYERMATCRFVRTNNPYA